MIVDGDDNRSLVDRGNVVDLWGDGGRNIEFGGESERGVGNVGVMVGIRGMEGRRGGG